MRIVELIISYGGNWMVGFAALITAWVGWKKMHAAPNQAQPTAVIPTAAEEAVSERTDLQKWHSLLWKEIRVDVLCALASLLPLASNFWALQLTPGIVVTTCFFTAQYFFQYWMILRKADRLSIRWGSGWRG